MIPQPPSGQGPVDPRGAFSPPPPPSGGQGSFQPSAGSPPGGGGYPPPGYMPPMFPMFPMMYPPPPPRRSIARAIFVSVASLIFVGSIFLNLYLIAFSGIFGAFVGGSGPIETTVRQGSTEKVAIVPIHGIVDSGMVSQVKQWIDKIEKDNDVKALVLDVDSPGGTVTASDEIYHRISELKKERGLKVCVSMGGLGASGGYYISCAGDYMYAQPTTLTGSIGVVRPHYNLTELAKKIGIEDSSQTAPPGPDSYKDAGSMFRPESKRDHEYFQGLIDQALGLFTKVVRDSRKGKLKSPENELFNGRIFTADDAQKNGLIDKVGYIEDACSWASSAAGLTNPTIVRYQVRRAGLFDLLLGKSDGAQPSANGNVQFNVTVDSKLIDELTTPRLQYLWKGQ